MRGTEHRLWEHGGTRPPTREEWAAINEVFGSPMQPSVLAKLPITDTDRLLWAAINAGYQLADRDYFEQLEEVQMAGASDVEILGFAAKRGAIEGLKAQAGKLLGFFKPITSKLGISSPLGKQIAPSRVAPTKGGTKQVKIGQQGEKSAGIDPSKKTAIPSITHPGKYRVPDELTEVSLREIKNVAKLSNTAQLRDYLLIAQKSGRTFILETRANTKISGPLQKLIDEGLIIHRTIGQ